MISVLKKIMNLPKTIAILYNRYIVKDAKRTVKTACAVLDNYAKDVLGTDITKENFEEVKYMYLEAAEHNFDIREILLSFAETFIAFITSYVLILVKEEDIYLGFAQSALSFIVFFLVVFYIPNRIKAWGSKKSKISKTIEELTYSRYKKNK